MPIVDHYRKTAGDILIEKGPLILERIALNETSRKKGFAALIHSVGERNTPPRGFL
jgi:hypothetical protein